MKTIKAIELQFENCEGLRLGINVLGRVYLGKINTEVARIACNAVAETDFVDEVALEIFSEAEQLGEWAPSWGDSHKLERIAKYDDITHIYVLYEDGTEHTYCIDYEEAYDGLGAPNKNQKSHFSSLGNLYVVISANKDIKDYFPDEEIEDKEGISFKKDMYDIGVKKMVQVKKYVKKPIAIDAIQYTGDNRQELLEFTEGKALFADKNGKIELIIHTLEGDMTAVPGCYIVRGPRGEYYPVQQDIFEETYTEVSDD